MNCHILEFYDATWQTANPFTEFSIGYFWHKCNEIQHNKATKRTINLLSPLQ